MFHYVPSQVKDPDNKNSFTESHTCSLMNSISGDEDSFYISLTSQRNLLRVKSNKVVDFEKKKLYNITVSCKDAKLSISKPFLIEITGKYWLFIIFNMI